VLSAFGRDDAAQRWHDGDNGPDAPMARATKRVCRDCGFMVPLAGALGAMFGVCCNALAADGRVVDYFYGCGAHSDTPAPAGAGSPLYEPYDDGVLEIVDVPPVEVLTVVTEAAVEAVAEEAADTEAQASAPEPPASEGDELPAPAEAAPVVEE
jgi:hypothetical protein